MFHQVQIFVTFLLFKSVYANEYFYESFGFGGEGQPILIGFILFSNLLAPVSVALSFGHNYLTRSWEYQADAFAAKFNHTDDLYSALVVLFKENKAKLDPDPLYEAVCSIHFILSLIHITFVVVGLRSITTITPVLSTGSKH